MEVTEYRDYKEYKKELDAEVSRAAEGFVRIGYLLKVARDTSILYESPYSNVVEFAQAEYGIDKTQVSRFININDRFSEGGYSDRLKENYQGYGVAKLSLMLSLPDAVNEVLSPSYSKTEIRMIKEEVDAEQKTTDLEVMMEAQEAEKGEEKQRGISAAEDLLRRVIWQLGKEETKLYREIHRAFQEEEGISALQEILAPDGERTYSIRIPGIGRILLTLKEEDKVTLLNIRTGKKEEYSWQDMADALQEIMITDIEATKSWQQIYGDTMPEKPEEEKTLPKVSKEKVAPVQQKKKGKVVKVEEKKKLEKKDDISIPEAITGQMEVKDYPELLPESSKEKVAPVQLAETPEEEREKHLARLRESLTALYQAAVKATLEQIDEIQGEIDRLHILRGVER